MTSDGECQCQDVTKRGGRYPMTGPSPTTTTTAVQSTVFILCRHDCTVGHSNKIDSKNQTSVLEGPTSSNNLPHHKSFRFLVPVFKHHRELFDLPSSNCILLPTTPIFLVFLQASSVLSFSSFTVLLPSFFY